MKIIVVKFANKKYLKTRMSETEKSEHNMVASINTSQGPLK